jgi:hypothetical protein
MPDKASFATIAIIISAISFLPYIWSTLKGKVRPHVLSWSIWGLTTTIVFGTAHRRRWRGCLARWACRVDGFLIAIIAFTKRGELRITPTDWLFFGLALGALPLWYVTDNPLWAVLLVTAVDILGFGPTIRKAYHQPQTESVLFFSLIVLRNVFVLLALEQYSLTTALFPAAIGTMALIVTATVISQRPAGARFS